MKESAPINQESRSQDLMSIDDKTFIQFMHGGSPLWVNQGIKNLEEFKPINKEIVNEKGQKDAKERR
jgi:hypothetical protein